MYDLVAGPKPADVEPTPVPEEILYDTGVPGVLSGTPKLADYGTFALDDMEVAPDASGNMNIVGAHEVTMALYYVDELATDLWASLDAAIDDDTDPVTVACTVNPDTSARVPVGDFVVFNDEAADPNNPGRRSYECAQIIGPGNDGRCGSHRQLPVPARVSGRRPRGPGHLRDAAVRAPGRHPLLQARPEDVHLQRQEGLLPDAGTARRASRRSSPRPASSRRSSAWPTTSATGRSRCSRSRTTTSRSCPATGRATAAPTRSRSPARSRSQDNVVIPMKVQDAASIRCIYAYVQQGTTDGQSALPGEVSPRRRRDVGTAGVHGHRADRSRTAYKNTYDFLVDAGLRQARDAPPAVRRLRHHPRRRRSPAARRSRRSQTASYGANQLGFDVGEFVFIDLGRPNEEYVKVHRRRSGQPDVRRHRDQEPRRRRAHPPDDLADADAQRGRRPGVRYPGGRVARSGLRSDRGDPDVSRGIQALSRVDFDGRCLMPSIGEIGRFATSGSAS